MGQRDYFYDDILLIADMGRSAQGWLSYMLCYILNARFVEPYDLLQGRGYTASEPIRENTRGSLPNREPTRFKQVLKTHEFPAAGYNLTPAIIYLTRDPRDVAVSMLHLSLNRWKAGDRRFNNLLHTIPACGDILVARRWRAHVAAWCSMNVYHIRYEDLRHDTAGTLIRAADHFGVAADRGIVETAIDLFSFERAYGRKRGVEDKSNSEARKGVIGDYRNYFSPWRHRLFWAICGREAERVGYQLDGSTTTEPTS